MLNLVSEVKLKFEVSKLDPSGCFVGRNSKDCSKFLIFQFLIFVS